MTSLYKNKIIVIIGATATNKTILALALAKMFDGEIINADAFQVYRELNIGVNKPTIVEMQATKFHLVSHISIKDKWDIKKFQKEASDVIKGIHKRNRLPIIVGGSHLYVDALTKNYDLNISKERDDRFNDLSISTLQTELSQYDKSLAQKIGNNHKRLVRALQNFVDQNAMHTTKVPIYEPLYIVCEKPREQLYQDINARVDKMIQNGWFEEVQQIIKTTKNYEQLNAFKAIGYLSIARGLCNPTHGIDINKIKQQTRQYAKRQLTWIRHHYDNVCTYKQDNLDDVVAYVKQWLKR